MLLCSVRRKLLSRSKRGRRIVARWIAPCMLTRSTSDFLFTNKESKVQSRPTSARYFVMPTSVEGSKASADHSERKGSASIASRSWVSSMARFLNQWGQEMVKGNNLWSAVHGLGAVDPLAGRHECLEHIGCLCGASGFRDARKLFPQRFRALG